MPARPGRARARWLLPSGTRVPLARCGIGCARSGRSGCTRKDSGRRAAAAARTAEGGGRAGGAALAPAVPAGQGAGEAAVQVARHWRRLIRPARGGRPCRWHGPGVDGSGRPGPSAPVPVARRWPRQRQVAASPARELLKGNMMCPMVPEGARVGTFRSPGAAQDAARNKALRLSRRQSREFARSACRGLRPGVGMRWKEGCQAEPVATAWLFVRPPPRLLQGGGRGWPEGVVPFERRGRHPNSG